MELMLMCHELGCIADRHWGGPNVSLVSSTMPSPQELYQRFHVAAVMAAPILQLWLL